MENLASVFSENNIKLVIKILQLTLLALFVIFSLLTIRQVDLMNRSVVSSIRFEVKVIAYLQLFLGIGVFLVILFR